MAISLKDVKKYQIKESLKEQVEINTGTDILLIVEQSKRYSANPLSGHNFLSDKKIDL
jgi:hypothetical protein